MEKTRDRKLLTFLRLAQASGDDYKKFVSKLFDDEPKKKLIWTPD